MPRSELQPGGATPAVSTRPSRQNGDEGDPVRVVIADGRAVIAAALEAFLDKEGGFRVLRTCTSGTEAARVVRALGPDVLLVGLCTPPDCGLALIRTLRKQGEECPVVLLADEIDENDTMEALRIGVNGIVLTGMPPSLVSECLRQVAHGKQWIEKIAVSRALESLLRRQEAERAASTSLTPREIELVRLVSSGLKNREIARKLSLQEGTVKVYLNTIYRKLDVSGRVELTRHAQKADLI